MYSLFRFRKTNHQKHAKAHRSHLEAHFAKIDAKQGTSFAAELLQYCPKEPENKSNKRKAAVGCGKEPKKKKPAGDKAKPLADMTDSEREEYAMESLRKYIQDAGGKY